MVKQSGKTIHKVVDHLFYHLLFSHVGYSKINFSQSFTTDEYVLLNSKKIIFCFIASSFTKN